MVNYENGWIVTEKMYFEQTYFDMSNIMSNIQVDGCMGIPVCSLTNGVHVFQKNSYYATMERDTGNDEIGSKKVKMLGRIQEVELEDGGGFTTYYANDQASVLLEFHTAPKQYHFGFLLDLEDVYRYKQSFAPLVMNHQVHHGITLVVDEVYTLYFESDGEFVCREVEGAGYHYSLKEPTYIMMHVNQKLTPSEIKAQAQTYNASLYHEALEGFELAYYCSCLNAAKSMWKEVDGWKGLFAGINYQRPARTYYRDSYYTALPLMKDHPEWMKAQILTLANGVFDDFSTPSGVGINGSYWWKDHHDGLAYLWLMIDEYLGVHHDATLLDHPIKQTTLRQFLKAVSDHMCSLCNAVGVWERKPYDRHDWVDNVYREGVIMYINALVAQALVVASKHLDDDTYLLQSKKMVATIEELLWDEEKQYYINYRSERQYEDHLSIDTIFYAYFELGDPIRRQKMLSQMEQILESQNNQEQPFVEFGTFCVYPPYRYKEALVEKSSRPFLYHNGSDWPYLSSMYALTKYKNQMEYTYPLYRWFQEMMNNGYYTPIEYYTPTYPVGGMLQGWSGVGAYALQKRIEGGNTRCNNTKN